MASLRPLALACLVLLAGCAAPAHHGTAGAPATTPSPAAQAAPAAAAPEVLHVTKSYAFKQLPDAEAAKVTVTEQPQQLTDLPAPADLARVVVELKWTRYAPAAGVEQADFRVRQGNGGSILNRTTVTDARGVMTVTLASEDLAGGLSVDFYPWGDPAAASGPGDYTVYATFFSGGEPPAGFTAVPG